MVSGLSEYGECLIRLIDIFFIPDKFFVLCWPLGFDYFVLLVNVIVADFVVLVGFSKPVYASILRRQV